MAFREKGFYLKWHNKKNIIKEDDKIDENDN